MKRSPPVLPGSQKLGCGDSGRSERPHILLCAPSNAAVDELVKRLLKEGLVIDSAQWKAKNSKGKRLEESTVDVVSTLNSFGCPHCCFFLLKSEG